MRFLHTLCIGLRIEEYCTINVTVTCISGGFYGKLLCVNSISGCASYMVLLGYLVGCYQDFISPRQQLHVYFNVVIGLI